MNAGASFGGAEFEASAIALTLVGAVLIGLTKSGLGSGTPLAVACIALALPARTAIAVAAPLMLLGDVIAVSRYRESANWRLLVRLVPGLVPGMIVGSWFLSSADGRTVRTAIAGLLMASLALQLLGATRSGTERWFAGFTGCMCLALTAGFASTVAAAAGPLLVLYLLSTAKSVTGVLGDVAWFYLTVNAVKVGVLGSLGLFTSDIVIGALVLAPAVVAGSAAGAAISKFLDLRRLELATLALTFVTIALFLME
jgi:uncharacterized membrane protein YfcA